MPRPTLIHVRAEMYPSIGEFSRPSSSSQASSSQQQSSAGGQGAPRWPPSQFPGSHNGPTTPLQTAPSLGTNFPMLRVHIAEQFRTFPPVMINSALEEIPRSSFSFDFSYEQQLLRRLQSSTDATPSNISDPLQTAVDRYMQLGFTREEVSLALAAAGDSENLNGDKVVEFCKNYKELKSMGFDTATVVGALVLHKSDLSAATDACLSS